MYFYHAYDITEEITRVPLIIKMPGDLRGGRVVEEQVQSSDIFTTILDVAGIPYKENILSRSLVPLIQGHGSFGRKYAYSYSSKAQNFSVRDGKFKLIYSNKNGKYALYDIGSVPMETTDVSADKPEVFQRMKDELDAFRQAFLLFAAEQKGEKPPEIDDETKKRLQALGYIQ